MNILLIIIIVVAIVLAIIGGITQAVSWLLWVGIALALIAIIAWIIRSIAGRSNT